MTDYWQKPDSDLANNIRSFGMPAHGPLWIWTK